VPPGLAVPAGGVYAVLAGRRGGSLGPGVGNIGSRPTFGGGGRVLEVHLLGFSGDLYGSVLRVAFVTRLRDERQFDGPGELATQIGADIAAAREALGA
jgi:riboflavin kinase/FMN adenylyltransferase